MADPRPSTLRTTRKYLRGQWSTFESAMPYRTAYSFSLLIAIACFQFEAGRNCPTGEGVYSVKLEESKNLEHIIDKVIELRSNPVNASPVSLYFPFFF